MAQTYKTEAIILERQDYKERDRMYRVLTPEHGKLTTRAISARKLESKLAGSLEPFMYTELFIAQSKSIDILAGSSPLAENPRLRESPQHNAVASLFSEIVSRLLSHESGDSDTFDHVVHTFVWLNNNSPSLLVVYGAAIQLFALQGYPIDLYRCHTCHRMIGEENTKFVLQLWNVECDSCSGVEHTIPITADVIKTVRFLFEQDYTAITALQLSDDTWRRTHQFIVSLLQYHFADTLVSAESVFAVLQAK